jgi:hypothetical protein
MVRTVTIEDFKDFKLMDQTEEIPKKGIGFR